MEEIDMNKTITPYLLPGLILFSLIFIAVMPVQGGTVSISKLEYPGSPETLSMDEKVPIVVTITYANMEESTLVLSFQYADDQNRGMPNVAEVRVSGSGSYVFPPIEITVPGSGSGMWPKYINEWNLNAEIWKRATVMKLRDSKAFTLLVENPENEPEVEIGNIEFVAPPDTIALGEETMI